MKYKTYLKFVLYLILISILVACINQKNLAPRGQMLVNCSGIPGDFRNPENISAMEINNSNPKTPRILYASKRTAYASIIPLLYIFDDEASYVNFNHKMKQVLIGNEFEKIEESAFWGEFVDNNYYLIPELDKCNLSSMLDTPLDFHAPKSGLLFVQLIPENCSQCNRLTQDILNTIDHNKTLAIAWVQINLSKIYKPLRR